LLDLDFHAKQLILAAATSQVYLTMQIRVRKKPVSGAEFNEKFNPSHVPAGSFMEKSDLLEE
jgi:hypothetical protein